MNDLYATCIIDGPGNARQRTDTHLRAKKGKGSFNWRMKFPVKVTLKSAPVLKIQLWDMDFFSANVIYYWSMLFAEFALLGFHL
jgi:hypothetical protein